MYKNVYSLEANMKSKNDLFDEVYKASTIKSGVREITYDEFMQIRNSKEEYILLDARSGSAYKNGYIEKAISFPVKSISKESSEKLLKKDSKIIVYCGGFECPASTQAAKELASLGYKVVDYKGGIEEWLMKGNKLSK
jgi:rhodanese-related sulfurtransferase